MKTKYFNPVLAGAALLVVGCLPSVQPLYTEKDLVFKKELVGAWIDGDAAADKAERWNFSAADETTYRLEMRDENGREGVMVARLVKLESGLYLDLQPDPAFLEKKAAAWYQFALVPGHVFFKVHAVGEKALSLSAPNFDWIDKLLKEQPGSLAHYRARDRVTLTASTAEMQAFIGKHDGEFWGEPGKMIRHKD